jgi:hypothetical protein
MLPFLVRLWLRWVLVALYWRSLLCGHLQHSLTSVLTHGRSHPRGLHPGLHDRMTPLNGHLCIGTIPTAARTWPYYEVGAKNSAPVTTIVDMVLSRTAFTSILGTTTMLTSIHRAGRLGLAWSVPHGGNSYSKRSWTLPGRLPLCFVWMLPFVSLPNNLWRYPPQKFPISL